MIRHRQRIASWLTIAAIAPFLLSTHAVGLLSYHGRIVQIGRSDRGGLAHVAPADLPCAAPLPRSADVPPDGGTGYLLFKSGQYAFALEPVVGRPSLARFAFTVAPPRMGILTAGYSGYVHAATHGHMIHLCGRVDAHASGYTQTSPTARTVAMRLDGAIDTADLAAHITVETERRVYVLDQPGLLIGHLSASSAPRTMARIAVLFGSHDGKALYDLCTPSYKQRINAGDFIRQVRKITAFALDGIGVLRPSRPYLVKSPAPFDLRATYSQPIRLHLAAPTGAREMRLTMVLYLTGGRWLIGDLIEPAA